MSVVEHQVITNVAMTKTSKNAVTVDSPSVLANEKANKTEQEESVYVTGHWYIMLTFSTESMNFCILAILKPLIP
jgi:hypothetical protein